MNLEPGIVHVACLAPSFPAFFLCHPEQLVTALKIAGFGFVEETASVLPDVQHLRDYYAEELKYPMIGESCPMIHKLIVNRYPHLIKHIPPIPSPMELQGKRMKQKYGISCKTAFFSPCEHKGEENEAKKAMDCVVTFSELSEWLGSKVKKTLHLLERTRFDSVIDDREVRLSVLRMSISGAAECEGFLRSFPDEQAQSFSELLYCEGGCAQAARLPASQHLFGSRRILEVWNDYE